MWGALAVRVGALVPRVEQLAVSAGPTIATATARLRGMGIAIGDKVADVVSWAKANPMNASLLALTLGSLGVEVSDLFESKEGQKVAKDVTLGQSGLVDMKRIYDAGSSSEKLNLQVAEVGSDLFTAREILRFAKGHYGSANTAVTAHKMHQAFFEMPLDDVVQGFELLRL